ncbi:GspL/Epsl periplasmic domain-containing protein [Pseudomonas sp. TWI628]|uniref:GspL/Epsl periplasmic domain-containing protein n=1 Tax=Pseudomonas sp. TWI628 TaxID=3136788 RepID=UPI003208085A
MKFEWRKSATARPWLLLRPGEVWDWLLVEADGAQRQGQGEPPANLLARVALIVPGECCSQFQLAAPPGLKRDEWPLLLEDRLLQTTDEILCACLSRQAGQLRLMVVERQLLVPWHEQCAEWGLQVECCWAEFQLLQTPEPGSAWQWQRTPEVSLYKGQVECGLEHWLAWPTALGELPQQPWSGLSQAVMSGAWPSALAPLDNLPSLLERPRQARSLPGVSRQQQRLLAACLVLASAWGGLWLTQQWRQVQTWRGQVVAVTGEQASPRHAAQALKRLRESELQQQLRERQLEDLQARLHAWLREHPAWRLQAVRFDGQRWHLRLDGDGAAPPWAEMASAVGAAVQIQDGQVVFDLGAAS